MPTYREDRPIYKYLNERPSPGAFGVGQCIIDGVEYTSNGVVWSTASTPPAIVNSATYPSWVWRFPTSSTALLDNSYAVYVPVNNTGDYSYFITGKFSASRNMNRFGVGRIGTQLWNTAGTGVTKVGTWTASTPAGAYAANTWNSTRGDSISFAVTGHTLVHRSSTSTNAGYALVSIDGSYTKANRLARFTDADLAASLCAASDVGKTYVNTYASGVFCDLHTLLADNLQDTGHIVKFEPTNTKSSASSATRAYIGGVVGCSSSDVGQTVNGTRVISHIIPVNDIFGPGGSAMLFTPEIEKATPGTFEFLGDVHGAETEVSFALAVDGTDQTSLAAGAYLSGETITIDTSSTIASTDATLTPVLSKKYNYTYSAKYATNALVVSYKGVWLVDKKVKACYPLMLPMGMGKVGASTTINTWWDSCTIGTYTSTPADFSTNGGASIGKVPALKATIKSSKHPFTAQAEVLDGGACVNYFARSTPTNVFLNDRTDGYDKIYFGRSNSLTLESFVAGEILQGVVGFSIL